MQLHYLRFVFFLLFLVELRYLNFKSKKDKYIWMGVVLLYGYIGYSIFLVFKRRLVIKRKFNPNFKRGRLSGGE